MIKPSELKQYDAERDVLELQEIEEHFDTAIAEANKRNEWPACPKQVRTNWKSANVLFMIRKYRSHGWIVEMGDHSIYCRIHRPE